MTDTPHPTDILCHVADTRDRGRVCRHGTARPRGMRRVRRSGTDGAGQGGAGRGAKARYPSAA